MRDMSHYLRYMGKNEKVEVTGYGHFAHGDEKMVDVVTAGAFIDPKCREEGWLVRADGDDRERQSFGDVRDQGSDLADPGVKTDDAALNVAPLKTDEFRG
jgi:hypothetical protein